MTNNVCVSMLSICRMADEEVLALCCRFRWPESAGEPHCPACGCNATYRPRSRLVFVCKRCGKQFRVTTGTALAAHKLTLREHLLAVLLYMQNPDCCDTALFSSVLGVRYATARRLLERLRAVPLHPGPAIPRGGFTVTPPASAVAHGTDECHGETWDDGTRGRRDPQQDLDRLLRALFAPLPVHEDEATVLPARAPMHQARGVAAGDGLVA